MAVPELLRDDPGALWVLDATDYGALSLAGEWVNPGRYGADGIRFSTHNFQIADGRVYMAHYHAGVWVLDLARIADAGGPLDEAGASAAVLGYWLPRADVATFHQTGVNVPEVWDVLLYEGRVYAVDINTGLHVLHYEGDTLGDASASGFA